MSYLAPIDAFARLGIAVTHSELNPTVNPAHQSELDAFVEAAHRRRLRAVRLNTQPGYSYEDIEVAALLLRCGHWEVALSAAAVLRNG